MDDDYLWAVLGYLRWYAPQFRALADSQEDIEEVRLGLWLVAQPIWGAVACELVRRGRIGHPGEAMQRLLASVPVPWVVADARS